MRERTEDQLSNLPEGTVTFLFTDIEGSTNLLNQLREKYDDLLAAHHAIVRQALDDWNGREVDTQGDAFFAAFPTATTAVNAVADIQRRLNASPWPENVHVRVRMGLHTGEPWTAGEGYIGMDVHRAARIGHAGYGGQVLLSETTSALVRDELPEGVSLVDLGQHRLKDMRRPETIQQLVIEGLPADFPPLKTPDNFQTNLPEQLNTFVGRNREMSEINELIDSHRLLTLVGPGGCGKTTLSLRVASNFIGRYPQGVWFVDLEKIESPEYVVPAVASTLQFSIDSHSSDLDPQAQLLDYLSRQSLFMVMDNFEHLLEAAPLLADILKVSPNIHLIVTSRERLNLREEWIYPMGGLRYPQNGNGAAAETYSGISLFRERARQVEPNFEPSAEDIKAIVRICQLVDGLPLAIELAAAWVNVLTPQEIASEIERDIDFLATTMRDIPEKHRSLRAIFNQSWLRIPEEQQANFRKLAVFRGGFRRDAAQEVAGVSLLTLSSFVQKSLLNKDMHGRFNMHPLLKAFAHEKLDQSPRDRDEATLRHSQHYVRFLNERAPFVQGERVLEVREEIRDEGSNVLAAVEQAITQWEDEDAAYNALRSFTLYAQTEGFHNSKTHLQRLMNSLHQVGVKLQLDSPRLHLLLHIYVADVFRGVTIGEPESELRNQECLVLLRKLQFPYELGTSLMAAGIWSVYQDKNDSAIETLHESLANLNLQQDTFATAACLTWLGWAYYEKGDLEQAGKIFQDSYDLCQQQGNILGLPYALSKLGIWADAQEQYEKGLAFHLEAMDYFKAVGDKAGQGYALSRASLSAWGMKEYEQALAFGKSGYEQFESIGHRWGTATSLCRTAFAELYLGQNDAAQKNFQEALVLALDYNYLATANYALIGLGSLWAKQGETERALELLTMAIEAPNTPYMYTLIGHRALAEIEVGMPTVRFNKIQEEARTKNLQDAIDEIRGERKPVSV